MNYYKRFCSTITTKLIESKINARLFSGSVSNVWLDAYSSDAAFFKSLRILFAKFCEKPFRKCDNQDLRNIDNFLNTIDKYEFLSFLRYGKLRDLDLDELDNIIQHQGLLEATNQELIVLKNHVNNHLGELYYEQEFEHEPVHQYIKSKFSSSVYNPNPTVKLPERMTCELSIDHFLKAQTIQDGKSMPCVDENRLIHESVKNADTIIFHPDEHAIVEAVTQCQVGTPTQWLKYTDVYDPSVIVTKNISHLANAKMAAIVLPDRSTFTNRAVGRYTVSFEIASKWYDEILQGLVTNLDPSKMYVEFNNHHLMHSLLWTSVINTLNDSGGDTLVNPSMRRTLVLPSMQRPPGRRKYSEGKQGINPSNDVKLNSSH